MSRIALSWSSGKDSAWTLHKLNQQGEHEIVVLVTTVNQQFDRVAMHAVRQQLLAKQAEAVGLPLIEVPIPFPCSNEQYEQAMSGLVEQLKKMDIEFMAFGDLFLEDIRRYREDRLEGTGIRPLFPLWQIPTDELASTMIENGLEAVITCVDPKQLPADFSGRGFTQSLLRELPEGIDPCGENGEFHSFVYNGPMFRHAVDIEVGETVERDGFVFTDVMAKPDPLQARS